MPCVMCDWVDTNIHVHTFQYQHNKGCIGDSMLPQCYYLSPMRPIDRHTDTALLNTETNQWFNACVDEKLVISWSKFSVLIVRQLDKTTQSNHHMWW